MTAWNVNSSLESLTLYDFQTETSNTGASVYQVFEQNALMPGVILATAGEFSGMISRRRFLEIMSRAYGRELFLRRSLAVLYDFIKEDALVLPLTTTIIQAAQQVLQRPSALLNEPIVVELPGKVYRLLDAHDLLSAYAVTYQFTAQLLQEKTRAELMKTDRLAGLGKLMAGVAHEIRNPVNFISGNLKYLSEYVGNLTQLIRLYESNRPEDRSRAEALKQEIDLEFILSDLSQILQSVELGTGRLDHLVNGIRIFSRMDEQELRPIDIHQSLDNTLLILNNRIKQGINVEKHYGELPLISGYPGQISQVFMNLISNAIDALLAHDASLAQAPGLEIPYQDNQGDLPLVANLPWQPCISIETEVLETLPPDLMALYQQRCGASEQVVVPGWLSVKIRDNGPGIPPKVQARIFEDFFTTKPIGQGTGLGLPISKDIIENRHGGFLVVQSPCFSTVGTGTEFRVVLPLVGLSGSRETFESPSPDTSDSGEDGAQMRFGYAA